MIIIVLLCRCSMSSDFFHVHPEICCSDAQKLVHGFAHALCGILCLSEGSQKMKMFSRDTLAREAAFPATARPSRLVRIRRAPKSLTWFSSSADEVVSDIAKSIASAAMTPHRRTRKYKLLLEYKRILSSSLMPKFRNPSPTRHARTCPCARL